MAYTKGKDVKVMMPGTAVTMTGESTTSSDNKNYQITSTSKRVIKSDETVLVYDGGILTIEAYTVNRLTGTITFGSATSRTITVTSKYLPLTEVGGGKEFKLSIKGDNPDITVFGQSYIDRVQALKDISCSIGGFYLDTSYVTRITGDTTVVIEFYVNRASSWHVKFWAKLATDEVSAAVDGVVEESVEFEGVNDNDKNCIVFNV